MSSFKFREAFSEASSKAKTGASKAKSGAIGLKNRTQTQPNSSKNAAKGMLRQ